MLPNILPATLCVQLAAFTFTDILYFLTQHSRENFTSQNGPLTAARLLDRLRERIRYMHYSLRTEEAYVYWVRAYIRFHNPRHPDEMATTEVEQFLAWLADERKASAATHRQAAWALLFLRARTAQSS